MYNKIISNICSVGDYMKRIILHADLNNFYASVECLEHTELRSRPMAVAGDIKARHGIILAKNELAKRCGIKTAMPVWQAKKLCPELICMPPHHELYMKYSALTKEICQSYTSQVEAFGPDECWMDVTSSTALFGNGKAIADKLRHQIYKELGLTVSVGVSFNKVFAKLGSDLKKPNATTVISKEKFREILWPLPVETMLFVGRATKKQLHHFGLFNIGDLAAADPAFLQRTLGKSGSTLWRFANGLDDTPVTEASACEPLKSLGNSTTAYRDLITDSDCKTVLYTLSETVAARLKKHGVLCSAVQLSVRRRDLSVYERQQHLHAPTHSPQALFKAAWQLLLLNRDAAPIRSLGIRCFQLSQPQARQLTLFDDDNRRTEAFEDVLHEIRCRFGSQIIRRAITLTDPRLTTAGSEESSVFLQK